MKFKNGLERIDLYVSICEKPEAQLKISEEIL